MSTHPSSPAALRLLVLDDELVIRDLVTEVAQDTGFDVFAAPDTDALGSGQFDNFDVVVLDLVMPRIDGIEVLRMLSKADSRAKLVLMSGMDRRTLDTARRIAVEQGLQVAAVLSKPFRAAELREVLAHKVMQGPRQPARSAGHARVTIDELWRAIEARELVLHFQPKICLRTQGWCGMEALARWQHPQLGLLYPDAFIGLAEHPDIALAFTYAVLRQAVAATRMISEATGFAGSVSVNLPPTALQELTFPEHAVEIIDASGLDRSRIVFEVTETSIPRDLAVSLDILTRLHMRQVGLSIDDFGTGHSSLERLQDSPFEELKIDMVFVRNMLSNTSSRLIVEGAIRLGRSLDMVVVAEGAEDAETMELLTRLDCDMVQGYCVSKPLPFDQLCAWAAGRAQIPA
jgi:EAL domain-containing protein (putative c-di-GMP-specific phosphodiesterase class I)